MPTNRFQFSDDFVLNNGNVGINSATPQEKLDVVGIVKGQDLKVVGVSSFTVYEGFLSSNQNITENITLSENQGITGSLSGEVIVGTGITVTIANAGVGTTTVGLGTTGTITNTTSPTTTTISGQGYIDSLKVYNTFTVPVGGTLDRPASVRKGMLFYNRDFATIEFWDGDRWRQVDNTTRSGRGLFVGGSSPSSLSISNIEFISIPTKGNGQNFGDLTVTRRIIGGVSDGTRGVCMGGYYDSPGPGYQNVMDYMTITSEGNAIDFGDIGGTRANHASASSSTRGLHMGQSPGSATNTIEYIEIQTLGNAVDFGDLFQVRENSAACASPTRAVTGGGQTPSVDVSSSEFVTISSRGNGVRFGELTAAKDSLTACSSPTRGIFAGGLAPGRINAIDFIIIASAGNAVSFGDLTNTTNNPAGTSTSTRGVVAGGNDPGGRSNVINFITIASAGNAQDFGDLSTARGNSPGSMSDSHGGLGGF